MPHQVLTQLPRRAVPQLQRGVLAAAGQQPAVGREGGHVDGRDVPAQRVQEPPVRPVPQLDVVVEARRRDQQPVRREGDVVDLLLVPEEAGRRLGRPRGRPVWSW